MLHTLLDEVQRLGLAHDHAGLGQAGFVQQRVDPRSRGRTRPGTALGTLLPAGQCQL